MKTIIAGSRSITDFSTVEKAVEESGWKNKITEIVSGCARGIDKLGEMWARNHGIPVKRFPADWDKHGRSAGYRRNIDMAKYGDALVAIWRNNSKGTANMVNTMKKLGKPIYIHYVQDYNQNAWMIIGDND